MTAKKETPIDKVVRLAKGVPELAAALNVSHQFIYQCIGKGYFPPKRAKQIEKKYGVPRLELMNPEIVKALN
jgi:hypothetical protein